MKKSLNITLLTAFMLIPLFLVCVESVGIFLFSDAESGKLIAYSAFILIPMSIAMITTSMLNSIGCEKHTLCFFLAGSAAMLLSVWFLPKYLGSGALVLGMALDYLLVSVCSLTLLRKRTGKLGCGKYLFKLILAAVPVGAAGYGLKLLFMPLMSYVPATVIILIVMFGLEALLLWALKLFDFKAFLKRFLPKKLPFRKKARAHK